MRPYRNIWAIEFRKVGKFAVGWNDTIIQSLCHTQNEGFDPIVSDSTSRFTFPPARCFLANPGRRACMRIMHLACAMLAREHIAHLSHQIFTREKERIFEPRLRGHAIIFPLQLIAIVPPVLHVSDEPGPDCLRPFTAHDSWLGARSQAWQ